MGQHHDESDGVPVDRCVGGDVFIYKNLLMILARNCICLCSNPVGFLRQNDDSKRVSLSWPQGNMKKVKGIYFCAVLCHDSGLIEVYQPQIHLLTGRTKLRLLGVG